MRTRRLSGADGLAVPKAVRCRLARCPLAGTADARCERCTGPVVWPDPYVKGTVHGCARACTSCPMDGLGLPVCWAACPGPNEEFATDGMKMVTLGGMERPDEFIERLRATGDGAGNGGGTPRDPMMFMLASRILYLTGKEWEAWLDACEKRDVLAAARLTGAPLGAFRGPGGGWDGSAAAKMAERTRGIDKDGWEAVRRLALGDAQKRVADLTGVRKQAVNQRIVRMERSREWIGRLLKWPKKYPKKVRSIPAENVARCCRNGG